MKKLALTIVCAVCALLVACPLYADEGKCGDSIPPLLKRPQLYCGDSVTCQFDEATGTLTISGKGEMWEFECASSGGGNVTTPAPWKSYNESIKKVIIEKGITSIGRRAFKDCKNLVSVTMPEGLLYINNEAFYRCSKITSIKIPNTVEIISSEVFQYCESLQSIVVPASLKNWYVSRFFKEFYGCSSLTSITWNAKNIKDFTSFWDVSDQITSFKFGNSVKFIPANICKGMRRLKSITLPKSVEEIGRCAFYGCERLATVTCYAPEPPFIGAGAFLYNYPTEFYVPANSVSEYRKVLLHTVKPIQK